MKNLLTVLAILWQSSYGHAQANGIGTIDAQRPTITESYSIIAPNMLQFENGVDYSESSNEMTYGSFVRGAISERVELRLLTDYHDLNTIGAKFIAIEPGNSSFGIGASFVYNRDLLSNSHDVRLALTKDFDDVFVTYNFGYQEAIYNVVLLGIPLLEEFNYFVEYFNDTAVNRIHSGITWIPQRDIQVDISGGWIEHASWYAGLGFSFRLR